jgi:mono/diheme cytochrome c family protein
MKNARRGISLMVMAVAAIATNVIAAEKMDLGKREYESKCVLCHGHDGKGGQYIDFLKTTPPDLSLLTKKNGGVFPFARTYEVIDGRQPVKSHGTKDMPIWGKDYQVRAAEYYIDVAYDPEIFIRARVMALIDYLNRLQAK